jgi:hypothetical protein
MLWEALPASRGAVSTVACSETSGSRSYGVHGRHVRAIDPLWLDELHDVFINGAPQKY